MDFVEVVFARLFFVEMSQRKDKLIGDVPEQLAWLRPINKSRMFHLVALSTIWLTCYGQANFEARHEGEFIAARSAAWNAIQQQTGLPRPQDEPKIKIFRGDGPGRPTTTSLCYHLHAEAHPDDLLRRIESYWTDLAPDQGNMRTWSVFSAHPSIAGSQKIDHSYAYYILLSEEELQSEPESHTVFFEIQNNYIAQAEAQLYAIRFTEPVTRASIITEAGYLAVCTQTLRCHTWLNDRVIDMTGYHTTTADYVLLSTATMRVAPPGLPVGPLPARTQEGYLHVTEAGGQEVDPDESTEQFCVIWRPDFGRHQPLAARTSGILTAQKITDTALTMWPEMAHGLIDMMEVHPAYQDDLNLDPPTLYTIAVWHTEFQPHLHLRAVLVHLRIDGSRDL